MADVTRCGQDGCTASVLASRGYCGRHGGPGRFAREEKIAEQERKAELKKRLDYLRSRDPRRRQYRFRAQKRSSPKTGSRK